MNYKKVLYIIAVFAGLTNLVFVLQKYAAPSAQEQNKMSVITTLFPLYDFARNIGGEYAQVRLLLPPGTEAHDFEPSPRDMAEISQADLFIYTGDFMEPWAVDIRKSLGDSQVKIVAAGAHVDLLTDVSVEHEHESGGTDPHIWLDLINAQAIVLSIASLFSDVDPAHAPEYEKNANLLIGRLGNLDQSYQSALANCKKRTIVYGGHYAFGYLAKRYGLAYAAASGFSSESEPTAAGLAELVAQIKSEKLKYIFYEELASPKIAEALAEETSVQLLELQAAHNVAKPDLLGQVGFIEIMEKNLLNLKIGLECR